MEQIRFSVGELKKIIQESAKEFEPKVGVNVMSDNKKTNDKSYKDTEAAIKKYDGGLKEPKKIKLSDKTDYNRTTIDYNPRIEPSKEYKEKVKAQMQGYTSKLEKDNGIEKAAEFDTDERIGKQFKDANEKIKKEKEELATSGIQGKNLKGTKTISKNSLYENNKPSAKRLNFKHTKFINEEQMLKRIPEEYKKDGQTIYMKDAYDNEYIVECVKSEKSGLIETNVISYQNNAVMNEQVNRIHELFEYKTPKSYTPNNSRRLLK